MGEKKDELRGLSASAVGAVLLIIVYLAPWWFGNDGIVVVVMAIGWCWTGSSGVSILHVYNAIELIETLPIQCFHLLIPIMGMRYYKGKTTLKRVLLIGFLGWAPMLTVTLVNIVSVLWIPDWPYGRLTGGPVPLSLLALYLLARLKPPPVDSSGDWLRPGPAAKMEAEREKHSATLPPLLGDDSS